MISSEGPFKILVTFNHDLGSIELDDAIRWELKDGWWFFEKWDEDAYFSAETVKSVLIATKAKAKAKP